MVQTRFPETFFDRYLTRYKKGSIFLQKVVKQYQHVLSKTVRMIDIQVYRARIGLQIFIMFARNKAKEE